MIKNKIWVSLVMGMFLVSLSGTPKIGANRLVERLLGKEQINQQAETQLIKDDWHTKGIKQYELNHQQEVWLNALEWCESNGIDTALNPKDKNGKRSVGAFQFQDDTFKHFVAEYQLLDVSLLDEADWQNWIWDAELQREIVVRMIGEQDNIDWKAQFPVCVSKKIGLPPKN